MSKKIEVFKNLDSTFNILKSTTVESEKIETMIENLKLPSMYNYYYNVAEVSKLDDLDKFTLAKIIDICQFIYNNTDILSPLSDEEYDKLYEVLTSIGMNIVGSVNPQGKIVRKHKYPDLRGSLDKVHFISNRDKGNDKRRSVEDWIKTMENKLGFKLYGPTAKVRIQPKWDGVSVIFECDEDGRVEHALLRGDTGRNEAVALDELFKNVAFPKYVDKDLKRKFGLKTEVMMSDSQYDFLCKNEGNFSSPRSATTSILNSKDVDPKMVQYLTIQPLQVQYEGDAEDDIVILNQYDYNNLFYDRFSWLDQLDDLKEKMEYIKKVTTNDGLITDGVVLHCTDPKVVAGMGRENHINKFETAYKFPPEMKKSILKDIEFSIGVLGNVTPVAKIETVKMRGNKISSINLGSIDRFESLNLHIGDEVKVKYEIIPYLDKDESCIESNNELIKTPTHCPYCGEKLVKEPLLKCDNMECESRVVGKILNYVNKMRIANISISTIEKFHEIGILKSIEDLYRLENHMNVIVQLPKFGPKSYDNIIKGVNARREVYDYELFGSIGIPDIGERMFKKILSVYSIGDLIQAKDYNKLQKELCKLEGIQEKTAIKICEGILQNMNLIHFLLSNIKVKKNNRVYDKKVCFSKIRDKEFEKFLDNNNVLVMDSFRKDTDILIVPNPNESSSKIDKAIKQGKPVISIEDAYKYFKYKA